MPRYARSLRCLQVTGRELVRDHGLQTTGESRDGVRIVRPNAQRCLESKPDFAKAALYLTVTEGSLGVGVQLHE
jgi:hypothetical protein